MLKDKGSLIEIKKGQFGTGLLIDNDGYISPNETEGNRKLMESCIKEDVSGNKVRHVPRPFVVDAVFQKFDVKNANGRIYPESVLKKQVELYQTLIREHRALGECYTPDVLILTENDGWKKLGDVKEGESILTLNTENGEVEAKEINSKISYIHNGDMIRIKGADINDLVTPGHKFPITDEKGNFKGFYTAWDLFVGDFPDDAFIPKEEDGKGEGIIVKSLDITKEHYHGEVCCVEVENHTWFVMSNGKTHWTGNCNHPSESTIDLSRVSHNIIELHWEGRTLVGKLELNITDGFANHGIISSCGDTIANLLLNGYKVGVSSRGVGSLENKMGQSVVGNDFELICWDIVSTPSTPGAWISQTKDGADLKQYMESSSYTNTPVVDERINKMKELLS